MNACQCGCGEAIEFKPHHKYYGTPSFLKHHATNRKGKFKDSTNRNTMYGRSKSVKKPDHCKFSYLGQCSGKKFEIHHIDEDITNNDPSNLIQLCTTHHRLTHTRKFDLKNPQMLIYKTGMDGKRRY